MGGGAGRLDVVAGDGGEVVNRTIMMWDLFLAAFFLFTSGWLAHVRFFAELAQNKAYGWADGSWAPIGFFGLIMLACSISRAYDWGKGKL